MAVSPARHSRGYAASCPFFKPSASKFPKKPWIYFWFFTLFFLVLVLFKITQGDKGCATDGYLGYGQESFSVEKAQNTLKYVFG